MSILMKSKKFKGNMIYHKRICMGLNLSDIAKKIGCSTNAVHKWESGQCKPNPKSMFLLSKVLKVQPTYFYQTHDAN